MLLEGNLTLAGPRVLLRGVRAEDARGVFAYASDPAVTEFLTWETHHALSDSQAFVAQVMADRTRVTLIIQVEDWVAGCIGLTPVPRAYRTAELGYVLHRVFWGRGYALEAATLLCRWGFDALRLNRIEALCALPNSRSLRVLEKLGMVREGVLRAFRRFHGEFPDMALYSLLQREWHPPDLGGPPVHAAGRDPTDPG
ncbi:MAG: GNAT family N-acetyltransferase [Candidatus Sericytochromatia bacterium]|nr:GNAT family N-acetyltransferase [Candidatus Tanganyikabacteria bacterium]